MRAAAPAPPRGWVLASRRCAAYNPRSYATHHPATAATPTHPYSPPPPPLSPTPTPSPLLPPWAGMTVSGQGVRDLHLANEGYKFFKGVRTMMRAGRVTVRTT